MRLELPYPPSVGNYWGHRVVPRKGGKPFVHMYLTKRAKQYRKAVSNVYLDGDYSSYDSDLRLRVTVAVHPPNRRKCDLDNLCKSLLDSMTYAGVWEDDSQIDDLQLIRGEIVPAGAVIVEVSELPERNGGL